MSVLLQRLLNKIDSCNNSEMDRIISFYKTVLELERSKEPDIATYFPYSLHLNENDRSVILIDLPCNENFTKVFLDNRNITYPKDLYVGLQIVKTNIATSIIAFSTTIDYEDLKGYDPYEDLLPIRISNLLLDYRHIDELDLTDVGIDKIEEINSEIRQAKSIIDIQHLVKRQFGDDAELKMELQLGLSSKNIALSQISSELNKLNSSMVVKNDLLNAFLNHSKFDNLIANISVDELIKVSNLDDSQASVVAHALSNRFTVVTGAPGTGKTQVILNIISNALMRDKTVLVASKNNKAVDNVKERFDTIDPSQYLIRFGKKEYVRNQTIPAISQILNRLNVLKNQPDTLSDLLNQHRDLISSVENAKKKLSRIDELKSLIPKILSNKAVVESQIKEEDLKFQAECTKIRNKFADVSHLENVSFEKIKQIMSTLTCFRIQWEDKYTGFWRIWYNILQKGDHVKMILAELEKLPESVNIELGLRELKRSPYDLKKGRDLIGYLKDILPLLDQIANYNFSLKIENDKYLKVISKLESRLSQINKQYSNLANEMEDLTAKKGYYINLIKQSNVNFINLGQQLVTAKIDAIEKQNNVAQKIIDYKSYIPDNIPWKDSDISTFIHRIKEFLSICRLISVTSLSVKTGFPLTDGLFDVLIIDEASQCDVASAIPLILRAKQVVIIGDPMQLSHITSVCKDEENEIRSHLNLSSKPYLEYVNKSLWDYSKDFLTHANLNNTTITLGNHYRCHRDIIGYSNHQFYSRLLDKPLNIRTDESNMTLPQKGIIMINIRGQQEYENININRVEADRAVNLAKELCSLNADVSIGIVTPFRDQADFIKSRLDDSLKNNVEVNTAHGFQGDEKDVIIYSLVITDNSPQRKVNWIDNIVPNLVNVAVTRARQTLYLVGNADDIKRVSPESNALGYLIRYSQKTK